MGFIQMHWRAVAGLLSAIALFLTGRFSAGHSKPVIQYKDRVVYKESAKATDNKAIVKKVIVYRDRVTHPNGVIEDRSETRESVESEELATVATVTTASEVSQGQSRVSVAPRWSIGAGVGIGLELRPLVMLHVDYRLAGPFTVGGWVMSDTRMQSPAAGLSLGVMF